MSKFSERLVALRMEKKVSQVAAAKETGVVSRTYQRYEANEREPTLSFLWRAADYFGVSIDYLAGRSDRR